MPNTVRSRSLSDPAITVLAVLDRLEDGERILAQTLMSYCHIKDRRVFQEIILELRKAGYFVDGRRSEPKGYALAKTSSDIRSMISNVRKPALAQLELAEELEKEYVKLVQAGYFE